MNNFTFYSPTLFSFGDGEEKNRSGKKADLGKRRKKAADAPPAEGGGSFHGGPPQNGV